MKTIAFFNNKGGVGRTTLVYHIAWMLEHLGASVVVADLDPQANLTAAFLEDDRLEELWAATPALTVYGAVQPLVERLGDFRPVHVEDVGGMGLIPGDLALSRFEDRLARAWAQCLDDNSAEAQDGFRVTTAFYRLLADVAKHRQVDVVLIDVGPHLGALNRAALVAADFVVVPLAADLFAVRGLRHLGPALTEWRNGWQERMKCPHAKGMLLPKGDMRPIGYVVLQHAARKKNEPARAYQRWIDRFPAEFHSQLLGEAPPTGDDPDRLAVLRHFRSLLPMSLEARKPVFDLRAADGALGGQAATVNDARDAFERLAREIAKRASIPLPSRAP